MFWEILTEGHINIYGRPLMIMATGMLFSVCQANSRFFNYVGFWIEKFLLKIHLFSVLRRKYLCFNMHLVVLKQLVAIRFRFGNLYYNFISR